MTEPSFFRPRADGVEIAIRVLPRAGRDQIAGLRPDADGRARLVIRTTAPPEKGRANAAVIALLAKALGVPKAAVTLAAGETTREKTVRVAGPPRELVARLAALAAREGT